jgi:hypothetical protein
MVGPAAGGNLEGFPRTPGVTEGVRTGMPQPGMEQPGQAAPGFEEAMKKAQGAAPAGVEAGSPMSVMEKRMEMPTMEKLQNRVQTTNTNMNNVIDKMKAKGIQTSDQLPVERGIQILANQRANQMQEGVAGLSKVVGQDYKPPAKTLPLLSQLETAQSQFQAIGDTMAKMGSEGLNIADMMRAQSQMVKIEQTINFFSTAIGETITGMKQLFQQQI